MENWRIRTGQEILLESIKVTKKNFESWFNQHWAHRVSKDKMLDIENSPVKIIAYKMTKEPKEVKEEFPYEALEMCDSCREYVNEWLESPPIQFGEYNFNIRLCKKCTGEISELSKAMK